jgi:hypothetical protein
MFKLRGELPQACSAPFDPEGRAAIPTMELVREELAVVRLYYEATVARVATGGPAVALAPEEAPDTRAKGRETRWQMN